MQINAVDTLDWTRQVKYRVGSETFTILEKYNKIKKGRSFSQLPGLHLKAGRRDYEQIIEVIFGVSKWLV